MNNDYTTMNFVGVVIMQIRRFYVNYRQEILCNLLIPHPIMWITWIIKCLMNTLNFYAKCNILKLTMKPWQPTEKLALTQQKNPIQLVYRVHYWSIHLLIHSSIHSFNQLLIHPFGGIWKVRISMTLIPRLLIQPNKKMYIPNILVLLTTRHQ